MNLVGVPYKLGGRGQDGMDCWGLAMEAYRERGIMLPEVEYEENPATVEADFFEAQRGPEWEAVTEPQDGDLVLTANNSWRVATHCGVYLRGGYVLHAVEDQPSRLTPWRHMRRFVTAIYRYRGCACQS